MLKNFSQRIMTLSQDSCESRACVDLHKSLVPCARRPYTVRSKHSTSLPESFRTSSAPHSTLLHPSLSKRNQVPSSVLRALHTKTYRDPTSTNARSLSYLKRSLLRQEPGMIDLCRAKAPYRVEFHHRCLRSLSQANHQAGGHDPRPPFSRLTMQ